MRLKEKVAIVTGSGRGIGKGIAEAFAKEGASVVIAEYDFDIASAVAQEIEKNGGTAIAIKTDVSNRADVKKTVEKTISQFGGIDILVNNAGIILPAMLYKMTDEQFDRVLSVHLKGTFICIQEVIPHMMEKKYGKIVNVASGAGIMGAIGQINYCAAKGGIVSATKAAAKELARYNITVNCIAPGAATRMTNTIRTDERFKDIYIARIPLGRWAEPEEIAPAFVFLASDDSSYITGQVLCVDGGLTI